MTTEAIIFVGCSGSGKSTARAIIQAEGYVGFEASEFSKRILDKHKVSDVLSFYSTTENRCSVARAILAEITATQSMRVVVSGFRIPEEILLFRSCFDNVRVIGIWSAYELCYDRVRRNPAKHFDSFIDFFRRRICEDNALGLSIVFMRHVDLVIANTGVRKQYETDILNLLPH